ncbi:hypothetical protein [Actinosynnema sp. NPDC020468]|uniref:hypothetical protein n=1 Tax=Actinosynnema sp. NPDC020468 TaxID=3154488 RepID=UPI0033C42C93
MSGYRVDPDAVTALAGRLAESAEELGGVAAGLAAPPGALGPPPVADAVTALLAEWRARLPTRELADLAESLRSVAETYREADRLDHD